MELLTKYNRVSSNEVLIMYLMKCMNVVNGLSQSVVPKRKCLAIGRGISSGVTCDNLRLACTRSENALSDFSSVLKILFFSFDQ